MVTALQIMEQGCGRKKKMFVHAKYKTFTGIADA